MNGNVPRITFTLLSRLELNIAEEAFWNDLVAGGQGSVGCLRAVDRTLHRGFVGKELRLELLKGDLLAYGGSNATELKQRHAQLHSPKQTE